MQSPDLSRAFKVEDPLQSACFENQLRGRLLVACGARERSLSDLSAELGAPLPKLHYHVQRLLEAGLLKVSRSEPRAGRPVRFFRAIAESFLVPQEGLPELPGARWAEELREALARDLGKGGDVALLYASSADGQFMVRLIRDENAPKPRGFEQWRIVHLAPAQRAALARDFVELLQRYSEAEAGPGNDAYLVHAAFAPRG